MSITEEILRMIAEGKTVPGSVTAESDLYIDLGYDSLSFVRLLLQVEDCFSITFELTEMGECVKAERLIALVTRKVRGV